MLAQLSAGSWTPRAACSRAAVVQAFALLAFTVEARYVSRKSPALHLHLLGDLLSVRTSLFEGSSQQISNSYELLMEQADRNAQDGKTWSVMTKNISLPGVSPHNYVSIGIYNHPCNALPVGCKPYPGGKPLPPSACNASTGLPWVPCDGIRNPHAIASGDSPSQSRMVNAVITAALAAFYSANDTVLARRHVAYGTAVLRSWFIANATRMLPNLFYGQIMPKATPPHPGHGGFIEWAHTAELLDHITLLRYTIAELSLGEDYWSPLDDTTLTSWWVKFQGYVQGREAQGERRMVNNHGSWYDADWLSIARFNHDASAASTAAQETRTKRVSYQILPNGSEWIELQRNVPSGYCQYNLAALSQCADLANGLGTANSVWDFETEDGRSLRNSIDWLLPFATGVAKWPYRQPEKPNWEAMVPVLRRASRYFRNSSYEHALCLVLKQAGKQRYYSRSVLNLQVPPVFTISCA